MNSKPFAFVHFPWIYLLKRSLPNLLNLISFPLFHSLLSVWSGVPYWADENSAVARQVIVVACELFEKILESDLSVALILPMAFLRWYQQTLQRYSRLDLFHFVLKLLSISLNFGTITGLVPVWTWAITVRASFSELEEIGDEHLIASPEDWVERTDSEWCRLTLDLLSGFGGGEFLLEYSILASLLPKDKIPERVWPTCLACWLWGRCHLIIIILVGIDSFHFDNFCRFGLIKLDITYLEEIVHHYKCNRKTNRFLSRRRIKSWRSYRPRPHQRIRCQPLNIQLSVGLLVLSKTGSISPVLKPIHRNHMTTYPTYILIKLRNKFRLCSRFEKKFWSTFRFRNFFSEEMMMLHWDSPDTFCRPGRRTQESNLWYWVWYSSSSDLNIKYWALVR